MRQAVDPLVDFLRKEAAGGIVLLAATVVALIWANSPASEAYTELWATELDLGLTLDLQHWVNDGLMAVFFFVVGLEIKRELAVGELHEPRAAALPAIAAAGGLTLPIVIFLALAGGGEAASGWAIPAATDIAFAVGALVLLGDRVPAGARVFLLAIAIADDIAAIAIIALFYAAEVSPGWLAAAAAALLAIVGLQRAGVTRAALYVPLGIATWVAVHESGVHATIAGVALGLLTPVGPLLDRLEHRLHPVSAFVVVPLFALANAGVDLRGGVLGDALGSRLTWAVVAGLVVGKLVGVTGASRLALRAGWGALPEGVHRGHLVGVGALAGIGFTVSLFIAQLAYDDPLLVDRAKIGIFIASITAGLLGACILARSRVESSE